VDRDSEDVVQEEGAGWEAEFVAYVQASSAHLRSTAFVLCGDWHRADDLVQVTFLKLYRVWPRLVRRGELDGYARRMVVRAFLSENRRKWRSREHLAGDLPDVVPAPEWDHAQRLSVRAALDGVPPKQRVVLVLRYWNDLSVEDTAATLGCSAGTVKSQASRGLATLRKLLDSPSVKEPRA
jgi:RNA polymerase sigma-70 factor (sigma-E family)